MGELQDNKLFKQRLANMTNTPPTRSPLASVPRKPLSTSSSDLQDIPTCLSCQLPILGEFCSITQGTYHAGCFICSQCKSPINGQFVYKDTKLTCKECIETQVAVLEQAIDKKKPPKVNVQALAKSDEMTSTRAVKDFQLVSGTTSSPVAVMSPVSDRVSTHSYHSPRLDRAPMSAGIERTERLPWDKPSSFEERKVGQSKESLDNQPYKKGKRQSFAFLNFITNSNDSSCAESSAMEEDDQVPKKIEQGRKKSLASSMNHLSILKHRRQSVQALPSGKEESSSDVIANLERALHHIKTELQAAEAAASTLKKAPPSLANDDKNEDYIKELESEISALEDIQRDYQKREITLDRLDEEIDFREEYQNVLKKEIQLLERQKKSLDEDVSTSISRIIILVTNTDMRPSKEFVGDEISNCLDAFRSDTFEYKTVIQDLKNQVHDLENARKEKQDELQDVLNKIKEADEMLSQKYSEYLAMGQDKERKEKEDAKSKMWRKGMKKFNLGMKKENAKDPIKTSFESLRDRASSAESLRADNGKPTDLAKKMEEAPYHRFIPHSYRSPKKCDMCQENMWGKEFKCDVCGFHCHVKCSANVTGTCKRLIQEKTVDKQEANDLIAYCQRDNKQIPLFVTQCIETIEQKGLQTEGLYRKSGKQSQVNVILGALAKGDPVVLEDPNTYIDVSVICSALKQFFRDLPEPLFVSSLYKDLMDLARSKPTEDRGKQLKSMIQTMPSEHQQTLEYLIRHLVKIKSQSDKNLMTASNLGVCFGPTLVRPTVTTAQTEIAESTFRANIVESLITSFDEIFQ